MFGVDVVSTLPLHFTPSMHPSIPRKARESSCPFESLVRDDEEAMATNPRNEAPFRVGKWHIFQSLRRATLQRTHIYIYIYPIVKTPKSPPNGRDKRKNPCEFLASLFVEKRGGYFNKHNLKENEKSLVSGGFLPTQCP